MPEALEHDRITTTSIKTIRRAEVTNRSKGYQVFHHFDRRHDLLTLEAKLSAHESLKERRGLLTGRSGTAVLIVNDGRASLGDGSLVVTAVGQKTDSFQKRLIARQQAYSFVLGMSKAYKLDRGAEALPRAINVLLDLMKSREYTVIDSIFEQLIDRVNNTVTDPSGGDLVFPREGSFWIACLTLTKGARKQLDLRKAFINLLRDYADSILEPSVSERLLRNVD